MRLRPVDLAREHGLSTQAVRNYERDGILPAAERSSHGYRWYRPRHAQALRTFLALVPAHGHRTAGDIMRSLNTGEVGAALALVDGSHAQLLGDRETLAAVEAALRSLASAQPLPPQRAAPMSIGQLAHRLGLRPATLRKWERAGLLVPGRNPATGYRVYTPADVRDAHLVHQLRRGGDLLGQIAPVVAQLREAGGIEALEATLDGWRDRLTRRGLAMLDGAAELARYVPMLSDPGQFLHDVH